MKILTPELRIYISKARIEKSPILRELGTHEHFFVEPFEAIMKHTLNNSDGKTIQLVIPWSHLSHSNYDVDICQLSIYVR